MPNMFEQIIEKRINELMGAFKTSLNEAISKDIRAFLGGESAPTKAPRAPKAPRKTRVTVDVTEAINALSLSPEGVSAKELGEALSWDKPTTAKALKAIVSSGKGYKTGGTRDAKYFVGNYQNGSAE